MPSSTWGQEAMAYQHQLQLTRRALAREANAVQRGDLPGGDLPEALAELRRARDAYGRARMAAIPPSSA